MDELGERGSTRRTLGRKSSESLVKRPLEPQVQKMIKSDQAHYSHSPAQPSVKSLCYLCDKSTLLNLAFRSSLV